jgi:DNA-binding transcriptional LysR family regulator
MELRHLRYFAVVAEELNFRRAAARLHVAQPSLSAQIRQLETEIGVRLLERSTRKVELTAAGEVFQRDVRRLLTLTDDAVAQAQRAGRGEVGRLRVGFVGSATYELLPRVAAAFRAALPDVALELHGEMFTPGQVRALLAGELDVAFLRPPVDEPDLTVRVLRREPLVALLPAAHRLAGQDAVALADLAGESFVTYPSHWQSVVHDAVVAACRTAGFSPRVALETDGTSSLVSFVAAGTGVAVVPAAVRHLQVTGAVVRPLTGTDTAVDLALVWRRDDRSPALARFVDTAVSLVD